MLPSADLAARAVRRLGPYREFAPPPALAGIVEVGWLYEARAEQLPPPPHRVIPENGVSLCFRCQRNSRGEVEEPLLFLQGPIRDPHVYAPVPGARLESVRLRAEWIQPLLGGDPAEHVNSGIPLDALDRRAAGRLLDALARTTDGAAALAMLERFVHDRAQPMRPGRTTRLAHDALERLRRSPMRLRAVAADLGTSERHVRRAIRAVSGAGAKRFSLIHRLNAAVGAADRTPAPNWARIASASGFFDQSHLIAACRTLTGRTPVQLHTERRQQVDHFAGR